MIITIINAVAIVSIVTGIIFFILSYIAFTHCEDNELKEIEDSCKVILYSKDALIGAIIHTIVFPPYMAAFMAALMAYIVTRKDGE